MTVAAVPATVTVIRTTPAGAGRAETALVTAAAISSAAGRPAQAT
ncbi:hypothetical protein [Streptomyces resistomycificus]|nr:hypothetical protein [Streptomyces resistomycificus]